MKGSTVIWKHVLTKLNVYLMINLAIPIIDIYARQDTDPQKNLYANVHCIFIFNSQNTRHNSNAHQLANG